jgi:hypothetical protein
MLQKIVKGVAKTRREQREAEQLRRLMRREAQIGGELFGALPNGHRREFFCLDKHTWVWHEEWTDEHGQKQIKTTRYDVKPNQILKSQNGQYTKVGETEARRLHEAARLYRDRVKNEVYQHVKTV